MHMHWWAGHTHRWGALACMCGWAGNVCGSACGGLCVQRAGDLSPWPSPDKATDQYRLWTRVGDPGCRPSAAIDVINIQAALCYLKLGILFLTGNMDMMLCSNIKPYPDILNCE